MVGVEIKSKEEYYIENCVEIEKKEEDTDEFPF